MSGSTREVLSARNASMLLLTDEENARVTTAEAGASLADGLEFIDLEHLERGVQRAGSAATLEMAHVIPRNAVGNGTWSNIVAQLSG